ncbi:tRNA (adenosine(37)-N6)-threonylcarbamoyltransferase complex dimerization subunit type 1 TsaB [Balneolaceae bacterium YR4-1]|uniref:tRNA (Adenosine(37)-N6)-threonylcarbamoyltransferase complex dimerization subunit type 1 TsaB n=1 Tax=Halalkalibaculum roseum TaxID=2709311 RepID=A0A6M1T0V0_9BACT|nr:tRNA (adenosine(37)-N6)-threonylcarbamoyltransferase complex dimerization subunit type 1 TsaB [Halalkalibaculum roseum]NGP77174.1 tRNA (adenosine(37)-N6)-threonylcarbamoyltransferase complex dimerization subunit type 1 TsaB [Halalkalibaculum roseum]
MQLALETSTNICSVALRDSKGEVHEKRTEVKGSHSEKLFLFIDELIKEQDVKFSDLETVVVSEGPGSYTGLRISASAVKGLLFDSDIKLYAVNTLAGFAESVFNTKQEVQNIHSIIDARRVHVYHQSFVIRSGKLESIDSVKVIPIKEFEEQLQEGDAIVGTGLKRLNSKILEKMDVFDSSYISAKSLLNLYQKDDEHSFAKEVDPRDFDPKYYTSNQV